MALRWDDRTADELAQLEHLDREMTARLTKSQTMTLEEFDAMRADRHRALVQERFGCPDVEGSCNTCGGRLRFNAAGFPIHEPRNPACPLPSVHFVER